MERKRFLKKDAHPTRRRFLIGAGAATLGAITIEGTGLAAGLAKHSPGLEKRVSTFKESVVDLGKAHLRFVAVDDHSYPAFRQHQEKIRSQVRKAPFVNLEYFDSSSREQALPDASEKTIRSLPFTAQQFFAAVGKICAEEGKDILVSNPETPASHTLDALLLLGIPLATAGIIFDAIEKHDMTKLKTIMATVALTPSVIRIVSEMASAQSLTTDISKESGLINPSQKTRPSGEYRMNQIDWRDVYTAKGLVTAQSRYASELQNDKEMLSYHGEGHVGVMTYLADPNLRMQKEVAYAPYNAVGDTSLRRYHFDPEKKIWEEIDKTVL